VGGEIEIDRGWVQDARPERVRFCAWGIEVFLLVSVCVYALMRIYVMGIPVCMCCVCMCVCVQNLV
jgi:hypothetical protein